MENKTNWKEVIRWILTIISAILAGIGTEACTHESQLTAFINSFNL